MLGFIIIILLCMVCILDLIDQGVTLSQVDNLKLSPMTLKYNYTMESIPLVIIA